MTDVRRRIPRVDGLLADPRLVDAQDRLGRALVRQVVTDVQDRARRGEITPEQVPDAVVAALPPRACGVRPVVNATGVLLHTNLGRAPLSPAAIDAVVTAAGCVDVEFDLDTGRRARRGRQLLDALLAAVPAAEAAHVVNNNAAALALAATALAAGREIVLSRGEMVEIGDGFRIPDLLTSTGARLREVGTTNRTTLRDYAEALGPRTGFVLKVHPSNFVVTGFTAEVSVRDLAALDAPLVVDIGSGLLSPDPSLPGEPDATTTLADGATLVTASGDKLLGGPQCGLLLGDRAYVERLRRHPLARAMRVDKLTLAALEATLRGPTPPTSRMLHATAEELQARATSMLALLTSLDVDVQPVPSQASTGGGGAPGLVLASTALSLPAAYAEALRANDPAVVGRMHAGRLLLDLRSVPPELDHVLYDAIVRVAGQV
ncbi:L-seryl-tRNA(Sec) selenium transferase [Kribbella capetownensis]|uniref:L-seryl-tRNA(Sec) selenium transferase n=1 Tax=Kribbella capetownensis TaxID=1572659 RepID=A0A4R0JQI9_9ACTN|nr:L-seryl-tRNA(Sec) selenium transferase [Kribbella capetownensis]TCC49079.1 L-seryl-tRNA(Sec) selenium transferase [Kribbella capetownensis]